MSRKRDTNWTRDEISVLLDSIMEITRTRAEDGKRTNSREVFEFAARRMGEKGHTSRAEREKCRTKWKKMKEEFTHAKRAREGDARYKEAPGIQPFYDRMEEFINGNFDNISPHSTIVRRSSSISNHTTASSIRSSPGSRASARIAANTNGTALSNDNDTSSTIVTKTNASSEYSSSAVQTPSDSNSSSRQNSRLSSASNNNLFPSATVTATTTTNSPTTDHMHHNHQQQAIPNGDLCTIYTSYNHNNNTLNSNNNSNKMLNNSNDSMHHLQPAEHADISYRVSTGCRQITIFGDHDVDIRFRGDCVTINKISADYTTTATAPTET